MLHCHSIKIRSTVPLMRNWRNFQVPDAKIPSSTAENYLFPALFTFMGNIKWFSDVNTTQHRPYPLVHILYAITASMSNLGTPSGGSCNAADIMSRGMWRVKLVAEPNPAICGPISFTAVWKKRLKKVSLSQVLTWNIWTVSLRRMNQKSININSMQIRKKKKIRQVRCY